MRYSAVVEQILCSPDRNLTSEKLAMFAKYSFIDREENIIGYERATGTGRIQLGGYWLSMSGLYDSKSLALSCGENEKVKGKAIFYETFSI